MLVKDECDVIETTVRHLLKQVDYLIVMDNDSSDDTGELLLSLRAGIGGSGRRMMVVHDPGVAYLQSDKTTRLAEIAAQLGHDWVVPVDADEIWYSPFGRLGSVLDGLPGDALYATALILNHVCAVDVDPAHELNPVRRLGWRIKGPGDLPKVACRTMPGLRIEMGNHGAHAHGPVSSRWSPTVEGQIYIHHYPWRSPEQFERKIRNGARAYAAVPDLPDDMGTHWRQFGMPGDEGFEERVRGWFAAWGCRYGAPPVALEDEGEELVYDPAPIETGGTWD